MGADKCLSVVSYTEAANLSHASLAEGRTSTWPMMDVLCCDFLLSAVLRTLAVKSLPSRADGLVARI